MLRPELIKATKNMLNRGVIDVSKVETLTDEQLENFVAVVSGLRFPKKSKKV
jgi:uncharacterized protein YfkK (UPF0435 family)